MQKVENRLSAQFWAHTTAFTALGFTIGKSQLTFSKLSNWEKDKVNLNLEISMSLFFELFSSTLQATKRACRKQEYLLGKEQKEVINCDFVSKIKDIIFTFFREITSWLERRIKCFPHHHQAPSPWDSSLFLSGVVAFSYPHIKRSVLHFGDILRQKHFSGMATVN